MAGGLSYQSTKDIAKSKNGYTVSIDDLAGSLQEIKQILNDMLSQRTGTGSGGACPAVYCTSHAFTVNTDATGLTYTGNLSLNNTYATASDLEALTCSSQVDCSCVSRTAITCECDTRIDTTYSCESRTRCECNSRTSTTCNCENRANCYCYDRVLQCNCDTRASAQTCACNGRELVIDICDCQGRISEGVCYCDTRFSEYCACDDRTSNPCYCENRILCDCNYRALAVCGCDTRDDFICDCNTRAGIVCECNVVNTYG